MDRVEAHFIDFAAYKLYGFSWGFYFSSSLVIFIPFNAKEQFYLIEHFGWSPDFMKNISEIYG